MKQFQLLSIAYLFCTSVFAQSAKHQSTNHSQILKLGVNTFFDADEFPFSISWEKKVAARQSIQIGFLPRVRNYNDEKTNGVGFNFAYRSYISKNRAGITGLFISPIAKFGILNRNNNYGYYNYNTNPPSYVQGKNDYKISQYSLGLVFGNSWVYKSGFSFEISGGISYANSKEKRTSTYGNTNPSINTSNQGSILPQLQIGVGYAF